MFVRINRFIIGMVFIMTVIVIIYKTGIANSTYYSVRMQNSIQSLSGKLPVQREEMQPSPQLLLNSGLADASEAELRITLWFEQKNEAGYLNVMNNLPQNGWEWETVKKEGLSKTEPRQALTIHGQRQITRSQEAEVMAWFTALSQQVRQAGGQAYLDERVATGIDVEAYFSENSIIPKQWTVSGKTSSLAGYSKAPLPSVQAGRDIVNLQLLSRCTVHGENTVLAIPALLEEF